MNTESPRLRALMAAGAALVVFGITIPATASPDAPNPNRPGVGEVGKAGENANPPGQEVGMDEALDANRGFRCDGNNGAGVGNPALGTCAPEDTSTVQDPKTPKPPKSGDSDPWTGDSPT